MDWPFRHILKDEQMGKYCITAANHTNINNHCASKFKVWEYTYKKETEKWVWKPLGGKSINFVNDLLAGGHEVCSAKENDNSISLGAPIEAELRIARNETKFKISDMPEF